MKLATTSRKFQTNLKKLRELPESQIIIDDDAPPWSPKAFAEAVVRKGLKPVPKKSLLSLRIDEDVVTWFRAQGRGYQSQMNALLRAYMEAQAKPRTRANPSLQRTPASGRRG